MKNAMLWLCAMCCAMCCAVSAMGQTPVPDPVGTNGQSRTLSWWDCNALRNRVIELNGTIRNQEIRASDAYGAYMLTVLDVDRALQAYRAATTNLERYNRLKELEQAEAAQAAAKAVEQHESTILEMLRLLQLSYARQYVDGGCN